MFDENLQEALTTVRHRRAADRSSKFNTILLSNIVHDPDRSTVPKKDTFGIYCHGIHQIVPPET